VACRRILAEALGGNPEADHMADVVLQREHPTPSFRRSEYGRRFWEDSILKGDFFEAMDAVEVGSSLVNGHMREMEERKRRIYTSVKPDDSLEELNGRFVQYGVGYQYSKEQNRVLKVDSTWMHAEVVTPRSSSSPRKAFEGPAQEFGLALAAFREGRGKDAVTEAVRAVESTAKAILDARGWKYEKGDTIVKLLTALFLNGLVPPELEVVLQRPPYRAHVWAPDNRKQLRPAQPGCGREAHRGEHGRARAPPRGGDDHVPRRGAQVQIVECSFLSVQPTRG
jgi:hypothetical protein